MSFISWLILHNVFILTLTDDDRILVICQPLALSTFQNNNCCLTLKTFCKRIFVGHLQIVLVVIFLSFRFTIRLKNVINDAYVMNMRFATPYFVSGERIPYVLDFFQNKNLNALEFNASIIITLLEGARRSTLSCSLLLEEFQ